MVLNAEQHSLLPWYRFLPPLAKSTLLKALSDQGILSPGGTGALPSIECENGNVSCVQNSCSMFQV